MLRKGQHLFNEIAKRHKTQNFCCIHGEFLYHNLHNILYNMSDEEFDKIMEKIKNDRS